MLHIIYLIWYILEARQKSFKNLVHFLGDLNIQSNLMIWNFLVTLKLFLNAKCSLSLWSKLTIGHRKWFLNTNFVPYQNVPLSPSLTVLLLPSQFLSDIGTYCWFSSLKPYRTNPIMHDNDRKPHNFYLAMLKTWSLRLLPPTSLQTFW